MKTRQRMGINCLTVRSPFFAICKTALRKMSFSKIPSVVLVALLALFISAEARAQFESRWLGVGEYEAYYRSVGGENPPDKNYFWPAIYPRQFNARGNAVWIAAKDFTDQDGNEFPFKVVHVGPRVNGLGEFFPVEFSMSSRFEPPTVTVNDLPTFRRAVVNNEVDPDQEAARMVHSVQNTQLGITMERNIHQFSQRYHDNYHILEYTLTNTGNVDGDDNIELDDQTVEGVYLSFQRRYEIAGGSGQNIPGNGWGANLVHDIVGDGMQDYDVDFRANYTWLGNSQGADIDPLGGPVRNAPAFAQPKDTVGRLAAQTFIGTATLHAATSADDESDDPSQPSTTGYIDGDHRITAGNDAFNRDLMAEEYDWLSRGHMYPHHADLEVVDPDGDPTTANGEPMMGLAGGLTPIWAYGPYTLGPGESVRIVVAEAADGLSRPAALEIGRQFKRSGWDPEAPIAYDANSNGVIENDETMGKNDWWYTGRDSLTQTFERAIANYQSNYNIPRAPRPPRAFHVRSGVDEIELNWEIYEGEAPAGGFELYRARNNYEGDFDNDYKYDLIATLDSDARSYQDSDVSRGVNYFYYIQSVGAVNQDGTGMTPTGVRLKSSRYWTQTYDPAVLKRPSGGDISEVRVVPNPLNLSSAEEVRWSGIENRIGFLDVPGQATITIFTELGERVATIEHTDGSGDEYWDLQTESQQLVVSGIYVAVIEDNDTGEQVIRRFVIIR